MSKLTKFKTAVASASSSSSSSASSASSASSGSHQLTTSQANALQALHQEQLARLSSITLPHLASLHSQRFLHLARTHIQAEDAMWTTQKLQAVQYRRSLWAEDTEPPSLSSKPMNGRIVPDYYHRHNARCAKCALPLVPGLNQLTVASKTRTRLSKFHNHPPAKSSTHRDKAPQYPHNPS